MYERPRVNVKVERGSTFTFTRDLPYIVSIIFTRVRTEKSRDSGNPPNKPEAGGALILSALSP